MALRCAIDVAAQHREAEAVVGADGGRRSRRLTRAARATGRWLLPSVVAAAVGSLAAGSVEAIGAFGAIADGRGLEAAATIGFAAIATLPVFVALGALLRGVWAAWRPRGLAARVVDPTGAAPDLAAWLIVISLAALALAWAAFQGIWLLVNHTAFKPLGVSFLEPAMVVAAALGLVALTYPAFRLFAYLLRDLEATWQNRGARGALLTPWRIAIGFTVVGAATLELLWRIGIKPKIGAFDTGAFDAPLLGTAAWAVAHPIAAVIRPRVRAVAGAVVTAACALAIAAALVAWQTEPELTLAIWGDRPLAGFAIDTVFDLDDIRAGISLAAFRPVERAGAVHRDIVLVTIDTVRADHTPPYSEAAADMPVLRDLAAHGTVFDWAFSPSNVTRRSIPSMVIGLAPDRVRGRVVGWALRVDPRHVLVAERLHAAGYDTAGFMCCEGFWGKEFHTGLQRGLAHLEIESSGLELARHARAWIEARDHEHPTAPLFLWMHVIEPHNWTIGTGEGRNDAERSRFYDRSLTLSDTALGEIVAAFKDRDPAHQPIIIVTADHGEALGEHGHAFHSTDLYDSQTHVPFVFAGPGVRTGHVPETVSLIDLVPTILDLAGFEVPTGPTIDGHSLADLVTGKRIGTSDAGSAYAAMIQDRSNPGGIEMVVRGRWKLIDDNDSNNYELYDTRSDPGEHNNVYSTRSMIGGELKRLLDWHREAADTSPFE
jgi:arylsulfatase A-like enzyme